MENHPEAKGVVSMESRNLQSSTYTEPVKKHRKMGKKITAVVLSVLLLCGAAAGGWWAATSFSIVKAGSGTSLKNPTDFQQPGTNPVIDPDQTASTNPAGSAGQLVVKGDGTEMTPSEIYEKYVSAVVGIVTEGTTTNVFGQPSSYAASGTGFVVSTDGYIITNCHVIDGGSKFTVSFEDGRTFDAKLIGSDAANDVALLKIDAAGLQTVVIGDSDEIRVGEDICAIGNPLGELTFSLTKGVVSALNRVITTDDDEANFMFQIDASVNSGNSGGPVFNSRGQVIGVVTAKYSSSGVEGLGFALPINDVARIVNELKANGAVRKVSFGMVVGYASYSDSGEDTSIPGARVKSLTEGSCAEKSGLQVGDVIVAIDGMKITGITDLQAAKKRFVPDQEATMTIYRNGQQMQLFIVFDEAQEETQQTSPDNGSTNQNPFNGFPFGGNR